MGYDDRREIFERLEALERLVRSHHDERGSRRDDRRRGRDRNGCDHRDHDGDEFDEKRVIDTIVYLVTENVGRIVDERSGQQNGGGEKRIVDLIVGLVSEHVEEIVARELDRRFGPADGERPDEGRPARGPTPPGAPSGSREPEQH